MPHTLLQASHQQISPFAKNRISKNFKMDEFISDFKLKSLTFKVVWRNLVISCYEGLIDSLTVINVMSPVFYFILYTQYNF